MEKTNTQIGIRVTQTFKDRIEEQARREKRNVSNLIIKIISDYLDQCDQEHQP